MVDFISAADFEKKMKEIKATNVRDTEKAHIEADKLLCDTLKALGYETGVEIFKSMEKYYA